MKQTWILCDSKNYCLAFRRCHDLRSQSHQGEAGSANATTVAKKILQLREKLSEYSVNHIFNIVETNLFYKLMPHRKYVLESEGRRKVRGLKRMKAKDEVTAFLCTNNDGSHLVPLIIIEKAPNLTYFRMGKPDIVYFSQENSWADNVIFKGWFYEIFFPFVRKTTSQPVALMMDNCDSHGSEFTGSHDQVSIYPLPPSNTSVHQPIELGITTQWKLHYWQNLLLEMLEVI